MKKSVILVMALLLCGCAPLSEKKVDNRVSAVLSDSLNKKIAPDNRSKSYYNYYLPTDLGVEDTSDIGAIITKDGFTMVLNFNVNTLIINEYYTDLSDDDNEDVEIKHYTEESLKDLNNKDMLVTRDIQKVANAESESTAASEVDYQVVKKEKNNITYYSGHYDSAAHKGLYYELRLKRVQDDYYIHLDGTIATLTSVVPSVEVDKVVNSMMVILKSIQYDKEKILQDYSLKYDLKTMEEKFKESNDFIYKNLPSEGYLEDLLKEE